ncbi:MAG: excinuclease ABC subunit UvrC [Pseudomonadales bacterium]|nr:excinuclease ABC subunit UvrC [Pseudomonadales bacterium]
MTRSRDSNPSSDPGTKSDDPASTVARPASEAQQFDAKSFLANCSQRPGVYQMFDHSGAHLYIGKAKNLKKRLTSYFRADHDNVKTSVMVSKIARIDVTVTNSETEALILERNLINAERPPYNVIFRDDKSYPYIYLSDHKYPRLSFYRGSKRAKGRYFGPFPSSQAVRESLNLLQKVFKVRQCEDSFFNNRSRPCLQHQIGRCSAPCVNLIEEQEYEQSVRQSIMFLEGKNDALGSELSFAMERAAAQQEYELAAQKRDQITYLRRVQENQYVEGNRGDIDILAAAISAGHACIQVLYVRRGRVLGSRSYYPKPGIIDNPAELLEEFIAHTYLTGEGSLGSVPAEIITACSLDNASELAAALSQRAGKQVALLHKVKAGRARWSTMASDTASQNLSARLHSRQQIEQRFAELQQDLELEQIPSRIECFDISHSSGEHTVASCVVFDREGAKKSDYRKFNIEGITGGDDYAAMHQALQRRYTRLQKGEAQMPDILLIDGGKGQMTQAREVFDALGIENVLMIGVAKGATRKPGFETLYVGSHDNAIRLPADSASLHLVQQIRDEAHRFAITGHRARRAKKRSSSPLEGIAGVGPKRRQQLLKHFGGWQEIERATIDDLVKVPGISKKIAEDVYAALHNT